MIVSIYMVCIQTLIKVFTVQNTLKFQPLAQHISVALISHLESLDLLKHFPICLNILFLLCFQ